jgi:hypothetical protein
MSFLGTIFILTSSIPSEALAVRPSGDWFTLYTPRFRVHHPSEQTEFAHKFARHLEDHFDALTRGLDSTHSNRYCRR